MKNRNALIYRKALIEKVGERAVLELESTCQSDRLLSSEEIKNLYNVYKNKLKEYED
jgi:hypothetical protein